MADKVVPLILEALGRAVAEPAGLPLHGARNSAGLFATTGPGKEAAAACKEHGYVQVVRTESRGKTPLEIYAVSEKGLAFLLEQASPKPVLEGILKAVDARQAQLSDLVEAARQTQDALEGLRATAEKILQQFNHHGNSAVSLNGSETWKPALLSFLGRRQAERPSEDCPLPELFRYAKSLHPHLTVGRFHDGLRHLHEHESIYLHPWTGPLYDLPEPTVALLVGHEIAYYASLRKPPLAAASQ